jgi:hypothetical protein
MKAKVLKTMTSLGEVLQSGDIVDVSKWRNVKSLVSARYIELVEDKTPVKSEESVAEAPKKKTSKAKTE